jgi:hypothetical protein
MDLDTLAKLAKEELGKLHIKLKISKHSASTVFFVDATLAGPSPPWRGWREPFLPETTEKEARQRLAKMREYLITGAYIYD